MSAPVPLRAIVGLGNPGARYEYTRHNAGFWFADCLAHLCAASFRKDGKFHGEVAQVRIGSESLVLLKPVTYMNRSGSALQALTAFYKLEPPQILVAHDDLDLPPGAVRLKRGGGHGGHNGLRDVHQHLGPEYLRLRIGIGHPGDKDQVLDYVLNRASRDDERQIMDAVTAAADILPVLLEKGWERAVHQLHSRESHGN